MIYSQQSALIRQEEETEGQRKYPKEWLEILEGAKKELEAPVSARHRMPIVLTRHKRTLPKRKRLTSADFVACLSAPLQDGGSRTVEKLIAVLKKDDPVQKNRRVSVLRARSPTLMLIKKRSLGHIAPSLHHKRLTQSQLFKFAHG